MIKEAINKLIEKQNLTQQEAEQVMNEIMSGKATDAQIAGFLVSLRLKGETIDEITACAKVMRKKASIIKPNVNPLIDVVGTGGDKSGTFNISTCAAFVVAGAGIAVAKHGNKSVSSKCGSADVLTALGVKIDLEPKKVEECINAIGFGYMFAPKFHSAMKYAIGPRKELGIRTVFNVLGPLTNPAKAPYELMGVFSPDLTEPLATVLGKLGCKHAFVVHGSGLDEITIEAETKVSEYKDGHVRNFTIKPTDFGIKLASLEEIKGGSPEECAKILTDILSGKEKGAKRDIVLLNAGVAIYITEKADMSEIIPPTESGGLKTPSTTRSGMISEHVKNHPIKGGASKICRPPQRVVFNGIKKGIELAKESIDSGKALEKLNQLKGWTNK